MRRHLPLRHAVALLLAALCAAASPASAGPPAACEVELALRQTRVAGGVRLTASARNLTSHEITLHAPDACPAGPIQFSGLPEGYDFYATCNKGACAGPRPPVTWRIPPGRTIDLASVIVHPEGDGCQQPLGAKSYRLSFAAPSGAATCGPASLAFGTAANKAPRAEKRRCPPPPACDLFCDGPFAQDANGCSICACAKGPSPF